MSDLSDASTATGLIGTAFGVVVGIFTAGWRFAKIEGRLTEQFRVDLEKAENEIEEKVKESTQTFDETLKGLRQKINDVELNSEKRFLQKEEFADFRAEYRQDIRRIFAKLENLPNSN